MRPVLALALSTAALGGAPSPAFAAPCCMSATAFGIGRLLIWEEFAMGTRLSWLHGVGTWDSTGTPASSRAAA